MLRGRWITIEDRLRQSPFVRTSCAVVRCGMDRLHRGEGPASTHRAVLRLAAAARLCRGSPPEARIEEHIAQRLARSAVTRQEWAALAISPANARRIPKGVILKPWTSDREKGVLFISFEEQWIRLLGVERLEELARRYTIVLAPSWSPPHGLGTCLFPTFLPGPLFTLISNPRDVEVLPRLSSKFRVVPLYASNWVNPGWFRPRPAADKDIDVVMLANFGKYKRHHVLFRALRSLPRTLRVRLVGQTLADRTGDALDREAHSFGVQGRYQLIAHATDDVVYDSLARARVSLILSRGEGSCVAVVESMFAGTPVGLLRGAEIGSKVFVNERTGRFLEERRFAKDLSAFLEDSEHFDPRAWVMGNGVSCFESTSRLNDALRAEALEAGRLWTEDIAPHHWRPDPELVHASDRARMQPEYANLWRSFGLSLGPQARAVPAVDAVPPLPGSRPDHQT